mmetsp:Transcript_42711/g.106292  ORF Transcript_42711/g.106292 Transcript_42711/m.106292 type:complete len:205 (+) Transcript_42711:416-1030(+)
MSDASRTSPTPSWSSNAGTLYYNGGSTSAGALNGGSHDNEQDGVTTQQDGELLYDVNASACSFTAFLQGLIGSPCQRQGPSQLALLLQLLEAKKEQLVAENTLLERHNHSLRDALTSSCSLELGGVQQLETVFHESVSPSHSHSSSDTCSTDQATTSRSACVPPESLTSETPAYAPSLSEALSSAAPDLAQHQHDTMNKGWLEQ